MNETLAIINATIYPISSPPIQNGVLIVKSGKIQQIGKELPIPEGACVIDAKGKVLVPGFVDAHTHIAVSYTHLIQGYPQVRGFHDVMVHDYGDRKSVSLHILMDDDLSLVESHDLATKVENALKDAIRGDVVVHFEPQMTEEAQQEEGGTSRRE